MTLAQDVAQGDRSLPERVGLALRQRLGSHRMDLWFGTDAKWTFVGHNTIGIEVASVFVADCITRMFRSELQQSIEEACGDQFGYRILVADPDVNSTSSSSEAPTVPPGPTSVSTAQVPSEFHRSPRSPVRGADRVANLKVVREDSAARVRKEPVHEVHHVEDSRLSVERLAEIRRENERRWDDFLPGEHNRLAYTAATMVLEKPGQISPLFIHGPHGSGKTHLAIGLAHKLRITHRFRRVLVLTGEQFTIEFTESARGGGFANFRRKYRDVEVLVLDDLQFCLGKSATLAELRNTIDMLLREQRQIILVADRSLSELNGLSADLHARLSGGIACGIEPLDLETRSKLLTRICDRQKVNIESRTIRELASQSSGDARVLQGLVHRLVAQQRIQGGTIQHDDAIRCTLDLLRASQPAVRIADIERVVSDTFGLDDKALRAKSKCQSLSQPRMLAMFLARKYTRAALSEIGEYFGNRQHSTVISAQKKVENWLEDDETIPCGRGRLTVREILKNLESSLRVC